MVTPKKVNSETLAHTVRDEKDTALVLFYGNWCRDCRDFKQDWLMWTGGKQGPIYAMEILRGSPEWKEWNLDEIPTVAAYSKGKEVGRVHGLITKEDLESLWKEKLQMK